MYSPQSDQRRSRIAIQVTKATLLSVIVRNPGKAAIIGYNVFLAFVSADPQRVTGRTLNLTQIFA
jgi:hypothetical protein